MTPPPRIAHRSQPQFPDVPEPFASVLCHRCTFVWKDGRMTLKFIDRSCGIHSRFLESP